MPAQLRTPAFLHTMPPPSVENSFCLAYLPGKSLLILQNNTASSVHLPYIT